MVGAGAGADSCPLPAPLPPLASRCHLLAHFQDRCSQLPWGTSLSLPDAKAQLVPVAQLFQLLSLSSQGVSPEK